MIPYDNELALYLWRRTNRVHSVTGRAPISLRIEISGYARAEFATGVLATGAEWEVAYKRLRPFAPLNKREVDLLERVNQQIESIGVLVTWDWGKQQLISMEELNEQQQQQLDKVNKLLPTFRQRFTWDQHSYTFSALPVLSKEEIQLMRAESAKLDKVILTAEQAYNNFKSQGVDPSPADLRELLRGGGKLPVKERTVLAALNLLREDMQRRNRADSTVNSVNATQKRLQAYLKHIQRPQLVCDEVDRQWCRQYDRWLISHGLKAETIRAYITQIIRALHLAVDEGICKANKAVGYRCLSEATTPKKRNLCLTDVQRIQAHTYADTSKSTLRKAADIFTFCAYTGLSYSDYCRFAKSPQNYTTEANGVRGIDMVRQKMQYRGKGFWVPLFPEAIALLDRYNGSLPIYDGAYLNKKLKLVAKQAGVSLSDLTHKDARSTFAQAMRDKYGRELAAGMAGHSEQMADKHYSRLSPTRIVEQLKVLGAELAHN